MTNWINTISTVLLVFVTWYYVVLTKKLADSSSKSIDLACSSFEIQKKQDITTRNNYFYLLNNELYLNSYYYVLGIYYLENKPNSPLTNLIYTLLRNRNIEKLTPLDVIKECVDSRIWDTVYSECAKYFSNEIMEELTGYYSGIYHTKIIPLSKSEKTFIDLAKGQLVSTMKCLKLIDNELPNLRCSEIYDVEEGIRLKVDADTGNLIRI